MRKLTPKAEAHFVRRLICHNVGKIVVSNATKLVNMWCIPKVYVAYANFADTTRATVLFYFNL